MVNIVVEFCPTRPKHNSYVNVDFQCVSDTNAACEGLLQICIYTLASPYSFCFSIPSGIRSLDTTFHTHSTTPTIQVTDILSTILPYLSFLSRLWTLEIPLPLLPPASKEIIHHWPPIT